MLSTSLRNAFYLTKPRILQNLAHLNQHCEQYEHHVAHAVDRSRFRCSANPASRPSPGNDPRMAARGQEQAQSAQDPNTEVVELKDAEVEGVAKVDKNEWESDPAKVNFLLAGDAAALLLFAAIGRVNHGELLDIELLYTVLPFWVGWFGAAAGTGAYGRDAQDGYASGAALTAAKAWAIGTPAALALRAVIKGYAPPTPFIVVSLVGTGVLLIGWRSTLAALTTPWDQLTALQRFQKRKNKKGNAGEFMGLLTSLTKRW